MSCDCTNYECRTLYVNPCDTGIDTGISVAVSGDYTIRIDFNGSVQSLELALTAGESIILGNILNLNYTHTLTIFDSDGNIVGNTCYRLTTKYSFAVSNNLTPTPDTGAKKLIVVDVDGDSFTNSFFGLHTIIEIVTNNQAYLVNVDFTQSGSTITWTNGNSFYNGQTILAQA